MKKVVLIVLLVVLAVAIVLAMVLLIPSSTGTENQNTEPINPELTSEDIRTQISERQNFLEKIGASDDSDITSILKQENPLDVFEAMRQQITKTETSVNSKPRSPIFQSPKQPKVFSVSPERVRAGDSVTIIGENFTPTNNIVFLRDGPAQQHFDGLSSYDGKTITFIYQPPEIKTMPEAEIRALPANIVEQIERPIRAVGMTLADALKSYSELGIKSEAEFKAVLESRGHKFSDAYNYFFVEVKNSQGNYLTPTAVLHGLPKMVSDLAEVNSLLFKFSTIGKKLKGLIKEIMPTAYAQGSDQQGGGTFTTVLICTCDFSGWMDFMNDYSGGGSGLWKFTWGSMAETKAGTSFGSGYWLGGFEQGGETCSVGFRPYCADISGSKFKNPYGASM